jgi:hypothetical protein
MSIGIAQRRFQAVLAQRRKAPSRKIEDAGPSMTDRRLFMMTARVQTSIPRETSPKATSSRTRGIETVHEFSPST